MPFIRTTVPSICLVSWRLLYLLHAEWYCQTTTVYIVASNFSCLPLVSNPVHPSLDTKHFHRLLHFNGVPSVRVRQPTTTSCHASTCPEHQLPLYQQLVFRTLVQKKNVGDYPCKPIAFRGCVSSFMRTTDVRIRRTMLAGQLARSETFKVF